MNDEALPTGYGETSGRRRCAIDDVGPRVLEVSLFRVRNTPHGRRQWPAKDDDDDEKMERKESGTTCENGGGSESRGGKGATSRRIAA